MTRKQQPKSGPNPPKVGNGRDPQTGYFLPGNGGMGGGRPRGWDFRRIVTEKAEAEGISIDDAIWAIFKAMFKAATQKGDVQAAKIIIERLCTADPQSFILEHRTDGSPSNEPPRSIADLRVWAARLSTMVAQDTAIADALEKTNGHTNGNGER